MSAEEMKSTLEQYQREHYPDGRVASAMFETGPGLPTETLVVLVTSSPSGLRPSSASDVPEFRPEPARSAS